MTDEEKRKFNNEMLLLKGLRCPCVVDLIGALYSKNHHSIVTELASYGSLPNIWGNSLVSYQFKVKVIYDIARSLQFLHSVQFIHRDIKPDNVLLYSLNPHSHVCTKLGHFGSCRSISQVSLMKRPLTTEVGTPAYMSPELLIEQSYSYPIDVFSFGVTMFEIFIEKRAYSQEIFENILSVLQFVTEGNRLDRPNNIPDNYWELLSKCWSQNPQERPSNNQILPTI